MAEVPLPPEAVPAMERWFALELAELRGRPPAYGPQIVMTCGAWGRYVDRFLKIAAATMLAPANLAILRGRLRLVLYTDGDGFSPLEKATRAWSLLGLEPPQVRVIPPWVMEHASHHAVRFFMVGVIHNIGMRMAAQIDAGFHMLMPDHCYGPAYFEGMWRHRDKGCVSHTSISANIEPALAELEKYRRDGTLVVPDRDLGTIAWRNLHQQTRSHLMNGVDIDGTWLPHSHAIFAFQGRKAVHVYCPHVNVAWLGSVQCARAKDFFPATMDTQLPRLSAGKFYVPAIDDGMTYIELSDADKPALPRTRSLRIWARRVWGQFGFNDAYVPFFERPSLVPIKPQKRGLAEDVIEKRMRGLMAKLRAHKQQAESDAVRRIFTPLDEEDEVERAERELVDAE